MTLQALTSQALLDLRAAANPFAGLERELDRLSRAFPGWSALDEASPADWRAGEPSLAPVADQAHRTA